MKSRPGVVLEGLHSQLWYALGFADAVHQQLAGSELVVTSGLDGQHMENSLHYVGLAADVRTRDTPENLVRAMRHFLREHLTPRGFQVIYEGAHMHIQFQPRPGQSFISEALV